MGKISIEEARRWLQKGETVRCRISFRETVPVKSEDQLDALIRLKEQGVQSAEFFIEDKQSPDKDVMEISLDDALQFVADGELVYGKRDDDEDYEGEEFNSKNALLQFQRRATINGRKTLYWKKP